MKKLISFIIIAFLTSGCMQLKKLQHMPRLLTLKKMAENGEEQERYIKAEDERFRRLLKAVKENKLDVYTDQKSFTDNFGEPLFKRITDKDGRPVEEWMYRWSGVTWGSEKVYLFFDDTGKLLSWDYVDGKKG